QAEDGIRDFHVTGVQTCALPIFAFSVLTRRSSVGRPESAFASSSQASAKPASKVGCTHSGMSPCTCRGASSSRRPEKAASFSGEDRKSGRGGKQCGRRGGA